MFAMVCERPGTSLVSQERRDAPLGPNDVRIAVQACGVCRTDLHLVDGELPAATYPRVPGHEVVGTILETGSSVQPCSPATRVGAPWLAGTCGTCAMCAGGHENLCADATFLGCQRDGGYATEIVADSRYCVPIPANYDSSEAAPLLCAGLIGYRAWRMLNGCQTVGFFGFGAAAHILVQVANHAKQQVFAFTRPGDAAAQRLAQKMGAVWSGASTDPAPLPLDGAIVFAPDGNLVPIALRAVHPGGVVVCAGIYMSPIPSFPYSLLWGERQVRSVANLTRGDAAAFFALAERMQIQTAVHTYTLPRANEALADLRNGAFAGVAVLDCRERHMST